MFILNQAQLKKYAELLVRSGGNVQKGQPVFINCDIVNAEFARMVQDYAYKAGASEVRINWGDDESTRTWYIHSADSLFDEYPQWMVDRMKHYDDRGVVYLHINSSSPDLLNGVDTDRLRRFLKASREALKPHSELTMSTKIRWSLVAAPSLRWAAMVFPDLREEEAVEALWKAILKGARADGENPIKDWEIHRDSFKKRTEYLDNKGFKALHFTNSLGTDFTIGLPKNHRWMGGGGNDPNGIHCFLNMPTEEIFTAPDKNHAEGKVVASMPLSYQGNLIEDFSITFKNGRAVDYQAKAGKEILKSIIEMDEGSCYLGEVALVANSSPISQMNTLFYNTLFDENASSHLALGKAYPKCLENGLNMSKEELAQAGINESLLHVDFMFGTADMHVDGIAEDGTRTVVMENGEFVGV